MSRLSGIKLFPKLVIGQYSYTDLGGRVPWGQLFCIQIGRAGGGGVVAHRQFTRVLTADS